MSHEISCCGSYVHNYLNFSVKPRIMNKNDLKQIRIKVGQAFTINVEYIGEPAPEVTWYVKLMVRVFCDFCCFINVLIIKSLNQLHLSRSMLFWVDTFSPWRWVIFYTIECGLCFAHPEANYFFAIHISDSVVVRSVGVCL